MSESNLSGQCALVFGASGNCGWAFVNEILNGYPTDDTFDKVIALTNRPLKREDALWPDTPKLQLASGIDLLKGTQDDLQGALHAAVPVVTQVTHVYFCAYIFNADPAKETEINTALLSRAIKAIDALSPHLRFVALTTGTKWYGVTHLSHFPFHTLPLRETHPRLPAPFASTNFYYAQADLLAALAAPRPWSFCNVMPDMIVGFMPSAGNWMNVALGVARLLALVREVEGAGATVAFPGSWECWGARTQDSSADVVARFAVWASLKPELSAGENFNVADTGETASWGEKWPVLCEWFGLRGAEPAGFDAGAYMREREEEVRGMEERYGLRRVEIESHDAVIHGAMVWLNKSRPLSLEKTHRTWGEETVVRDVKGAWWLAFERFREARIIP